MSVVLKKLYENHELPHRAKLGYIYLYDRWDVVDKDWPSVKRIAKDLFGISEKTARRALLGLEKAGLIREKRKIKRDPAVPKNGRV